MNRLLISLLVIPVVSGCAMLGGGDTEPAQREHAWRVNAPDSEPQSESRTRAYGVYRAARFCRDQDRPHILIHNAVVNRQASQVELVFACSRTKLDQSVPATRLLGAIGLDYTFQALE